MSPCGYNRNMTDIIRLHDADYMPIILRCKEALDAGELVILPTDTVYGLAARADLPGAVRAIFEAKGRDAEKALVVMVPSAEEAAELAADEERETLLRLGGLWPGPLTLVVRAGEVPWRESVAPSTIMLGIRVPDSPLLLSLLDISGPLAMTSANLSGGTAPVSFDKIESALVAKARIAVDGGYRGSGRPSTVAELRKGGLKVLRSGEIDPGELRKALLQDGENNKIP